MIKNALLIITFSLAVGSSNAMAAPGTPYSDEWVEGRVRGMLDFNTYFDSTDISVRVKDGVATLSGQVPSDIEKRYASSLATSLEGVKSVVNKLEINESLAPRSRSPMAQAFFDSTTTAMVESRLSSSRVTQASHITVSTKDGLVQLNGSASSSEARKQAEKIARATTNVLKVDNNLKIENPNSIGEKVENVIVSTSNTVSDAWISTKVKALFAFGSEYSGSDISSSVKDGKVTLKGYARSDSQIADITRETSDVVGVREVDNQLKVRESLNS